jgi:hypothetical protein
VYGYSPISISIYVILKSEKKNFDPTFNKVRTYPVQNESGRMLENNSVQPLFTIFLRYLLWLTGARSDPTKSVKGITFGPNICSPDGNKLLEGLTIKKIAKACLSKVSHCVMGCTLVVGILSDQSLPLGLLVQLYQPRYIIVIADLNMCNPFVQRWLSNCCGIYMGTCKCDPYNQYLDFNNNDSGYRTVFYKCFGERKFKALDEVPALIVLEHPDIVSPFTFAPKILPQFERGIAITTIEKFSTLYCCARQGCYRMCQDKSHICKRCHNIVRQTIVAGCALNWLKNVHYLPRDIVQYILRMYINSLLTN